MATGTNLFTSHEARILAHTPNNTTTFLRGDNSWSNTLTGDLTVNNLYVTDSGIYYVGTQETYRMIRFIDNTNDTYGNGISIGGGGLTILGSGESAETILSNLTLSAAGGTETTYIGSDGNILFYPGINTWDASTLVTISAGAVWAGVNENTTRETQVGVQSGAGQLYMWSHASTSGDRGIYVSAHGTGSAHAVLSVNTNNQASFADYYNNSMTKLAYSQSGLAASAITWLTCWNGYELRAISKAEMANATDSAHKWVRIGGDTMTGSLTVNSTIHSTNYILSDSYVQAKNQMYLDAGNFQMKYNNTWWNVVRNYNNGNTGVDAAGSGLYLGYQNTANIYFYTGATQRAYVNNQGVHNAVWNDFAEYRESEITEAGRVVVSNGKGQMILATERLQPTAHVISDTYGCSVGESDNAKTPIGVSGRVLVYPYQNKSQYHVGDALCTAPNGTADIMTRDEIIKYPERIIGIVDEIPNYDTWIQTFTPTSAENTLNNTTTCTININGRIWIYVR